jgi:molecular chaperone GrpE
LTDKLSFLKYWQYFCKLYLQIKINNMSQENTENLDKDTTSEVNQAETASVEQSELSVEEQLQEQLAQEKDKFLRLFAEFENYKKRTTKERIELFKTAGQEVLQAMLPVLDDFDRAWNQISTSQDEALVKGVELIHEKLKSTLTSKGLELVDIKAGDEFNADYAEAITQIPAPSEDLKGKIVDVIEKGYKLGDKIIRFPKVVIGN